MRPLTEVEILATLRNVLHGISREWWDIAREQVTSWNDFKVKFIAAFVSDNYEDEMADCVKEREVVKLMLKNISHLHGRANTVDDIVKVGRQLEKDGELQKKFENKITKSPVVISTKSEKALPAIAVTKKSFLNMPQINAGIILCWRCKQQHPPRQCHLLSRTPLLVKNLKLTTLLITTMLLQ